ncbi:MAG: hypothetical protein ACK5LC_02695 [Coprobacillaceae bacterium]
MKSKKLLASLGVATMLLVGCSSNSDELTKLKDENKELKEEVQDLEDEIETLKEETESSKGTVNNGSSEPFTLSGEYIVGEDIEPGMYDIVPEGDYGTIDITSTTDSKKWEFEILDNGKSLKSYKLVENDIVDCGGYNLIFTKK